MSYRSVLNVSNGGPSNPKLTLKINSLRIKRRAQSFASWMFSEYAFKIERKKGNDFFDHSTTLKSAKVKSMISKLTIDNFGTKTVSEKWVTKNTRHGCLRVIYSVSK